MTHRLLAIAALGLAFGLAGCQSDPNLKTENEDLRRQLEAKDSEIGTLKQELDAANARASTGGGDKGGDSASKDFAGIEGVSAMKVGNEVHVSIEGDVLFDSGKVALKDNAKKSLDKVAGVLKDKYAGKPIRVAGFTDTDPIKKSSFKSNYHLGFERAYAVREYLTGKGLEGKVMSLSSYGPDVPLKTKQLSRRVEIIVID
jgi:flagellar motor protein MotB